MIKFLWIFFKSVWAIVITTGIVFAIDLWLWLDSWKPITKWIWDTLVAQLETNTDKIWINESKNGSQDTEITDLKTRVTTLESVSSWGWWKWSIG